MTTSSVQFSPPYRHGIHCQHACLSCHPSRHVTSRHIDVDVDVNPADTTPSGSIFEERATVQCMMWEKQSRYYATLFCIRTYNTFCILFNTILRDRLFSLDYKMRVSTKR